MPARSLPLETSLGRTQRQQPVQTAAALSPREVRLRSAATTCLAGIALVQAIELPSLLAQGGQLAAAALAALALCLGLGVALATAGAGAGGRLWRAVAAAAALVLAAWAATRAFAVPGLTGTRGHWAALPAGVCAVLAAACLALAASAVRPGRRASARGVAMALAVLVALAPGVGALLVAAAPGTAGGEQALATGAHAHAARVSAEVDLVFEPMPRGHGGHYVYRTPATPRPTAFGIALGTTAALVFCYGAVGYLRRRRTSAEPLALGGVDTAVT